MIIQAIETTFNGYRFRSRLEARWAVFMSELGVNYEYEKEGFELAENSWYLPDFWLPEMASWLEIKGQQPTTDEQQKYEKLALVTKNAVYLSWAAIPSVEGVLADGVERIYSYSPAFFMGERREWVERSSAVWCACPQCGIVGLAYNGDGVLLSRQGMCGCEFEQNERQITYDAPHILEAYRKARAARFD